MELTKVEKKRIYNRLVDSNLAEDRDVYQCCWVKGRQNRPVVGNGRYLCRLT